MDDNRIITPGGRPALAAPVLTITLIQIGPDFICNPVSITGVDLSGFPISHPDAVEKGSCITVYLIGGYLTLRGKRARTFFQWLIENKIYNPPLAQ